MRDSPSLQDILQVENDSALLDFKCESTGMVLWPLARGPFLRFIISDAAYATPLMEVGRRRAYGRIARSVLQAAAHNRKHAREMRSAVVLFAAGTGLYLREGKYFNRLADHFAAAADTVVVEELLDWRWPFPRHNPRVLFHTPLQFSAAVVARLKVRARHLEAAKGMLRHAAERAQRLLGWELGAARFSYSVKVLAWHIAALPWKHAAYMKLLRRSAARVVLKGQACYGGSAIFNLAARELGMVLAEYQHGLISAGHDAYNVAAALRDSADYRRTLPQYFLGYGQWWNEQISIPVTTLAVGSPHRSEQLEQVSRREPTDLLILGEGIETERYVALARALAERQTRLRVVFRPHPLERQRVLATNASARLAPAVLDRNTDMYESFSTARAVASELSTGLFEAAGVVDRVFLWNTAKSRLGCPVHPFASFSDAADLVAQLENGAGRLGAEILDSLWAANWRSNYLRFLRDVGGAAAEIEPARGAV